MNRMQEQIAEFHRKFGHVIGTIPAISRPELRIKLIREEAKELCDAIEAGDLVEAVDGICDLIYVTLGAAVEFGVDIEPIFDEVHRTNMLKEGGGTRADGKTLKPEGWQPPRIAELIDQQQTPGWPMFVKHRVFDRERFFAAWAAFRESWERLEGVLETVRDKAQDR